MPLDTDDRYLLDGTQGLVEPLNMSVDQSLPASRARHMVKVAQHLYTFWHTGEPSYLREAVDPGFVDNTLPPGRPQGIDGPMAASADVRTAVPDLTCELSDLLVVGDKLAVRLRFQGHFTGEYRGVRGSGQPVDFVAFDIQQVGSERVVEDWHLEDNLTFLTQAELASVAGQ